MSETASSRQSRGKSFVEYVIKRMKTDNAFSAALRRADNSATEGLAWEYLTDWCSLEKDWERKPLALIAAAMSRAKPHHDGYLGFGAAIAECYKKKDGNSISQAKSKLRRVLACDSILEICAILRPLLSLISSRAVSLCYARLLDDLLYFGDGERVKVRWAADFYG